MRYRILYHHRTQALDGQRVHITTIQRALRELGHEVVEVAPLPAVELAGGIQVPTLRRRFLSQAARIAPKGAYEGLELTYNLVGYRALTAAIQKLRPHFIYERYALNTVAGAWASKRWKVPLLLEVNSPLAEEKRALGQLLFYRESRRIERYVLNQAACVLAVTQVLADLLRALAALPDDKIVVVHNGTDPDAIRQAETYRGSIRAELGLAEDRLVIGAVGFFREWHGIDQMLRAFAAVRGASPRASVLLVGDGPASTGLRQLANELGVAGEVVFTGAVPHDRIPQYLAAIDVAVIPRAVQYASPLKLFEYMAAGKAIVAPRQPNILEVLTENVDAVCFEPGQEQQLRGALTRIIADAALRRRLGEGAQRTIQSRRLTWTGNAKRIIEAFERSSEHHRAAAS